MKNVEVDNIITRLLSELDLNQEELAQSLDLSRETVNKMINGKAIISAKTLMKIGELYPTFNVKSSSQFNNQNAAELNDQEFLHKKLMPENPSMRVILSLSENNSILARSQESIARSQESITKSQETMANNNSRLIALLEEKNVKEKELNPTVEMLPDILSDVATRMNTLQEFLFEQFAQSQNKKASDYRKAFDIKLSSVVMNKRKKDIHLD